MFNQVADSAPQVDAGAAKRVLRQTYQFLSLNLLFTAIMATVSVMLNIPYGLGFMFTLGGLVPFLALIFSRKARNSTLGLLLVFAFTGLWGLGLGPTLNFYIHAFSNGPQLIAMAVGSTGLLFLGLSAIGMRADKDYSNWGSFLLIGLVVAIVLSLINVFFIQLPALQLAVAVVFMFIFGAFIVVDTNRIVRGGETNYIMATVSLYVNIINLFLSLLQILAALAGNRN